MAFGAILALGTVLHSIGAGNGKAPLGQINTHQMVVTQEVDAAFTTWTNSATVKFPKSSADKFYIGNKTLNQLLPTIPTETDPKFNEWYGTNDLAFTNDTVRFNATTNNFYIGGKSVAQLLKEKSESDPVFDGFKNSENRISVGSGTSASFYRALAIGVPAISNRGKNGVTLLYAQDGTRSYWRNDYIGDVYADRESVALGDSAFAGNPVSVAIGDQARVGNLHTDSDQMFGIAFDRMEVTTTISNGVTTVTTNTIFGAFTNYYDIAKYERLPSPGDWKKTVSGTPIVEGGTTNITDVYEQRESGTLNDISYVTPEDWDLYNRIIHGGQGYVPLFDAYYGVAVGSRAYVFGYHSVAYGHYSHASRPFSVAIGSESHVYSEGSQAFGYDTDIPNTSPYSLAIGANASIEAGMTNAIVIGVPQVVDFTNLTYRSKEGMVKDRPTAVKSNSINFAYHGDGINDFFLDGVSLQERLASEVKVVGNTKDGTKPDDVDRAIRGIGNIPDDEDPLVFYSGDGGIYFFTKGYEEDSEANIGDISKIFINGKPLSEIIGGSSSHDADFATYKTTVSNAAEVAINAINVSTNMTDVKTALTNFFNTIKQ